MGHLATIRAVHEEARAAAQRGATREEVRSILAKADAAMTAGFYSRRGWRHPDPVRDTLRAARRSSAWRHPQVKWSRCSERVDEWTAGSPGDFATGVEYLPRRLSRRS